MFETYSEISALKDYLDLDELIDSGLNPNAPDDGGDYLLTLACDDLNETWFKLLLSKGVDVNCIDSTSSTPLFTLAEQAHKNQPLVLIFASELIKAGANINYKKPSGNSIFLQACRSGNESFVQLLVSNGVDVNYSYQDLGYTIDALEIINLTHGLSNEFVNYIHTLINP